MNEKLVFIESNKKIIDSGANLTSYYVKEIEINFNSLTLTCIDEKSTSETLALLRNSRTAKAMFREEKILDKLNQMNSTTFIATGNVPKLLEDLSNLDCMSKFTVGKILEDVKFIELFASGKSKEKGASSSRSSNPDLWDKIESLSIDEKKQLLEDLKHNIDSSQNINSSQTRLGQVIVK